MIVPNGLADDEGSSGSAFGYLAAGVGILAAIWMIGLFTTTQTAIKTAPKLGKFIPFL